MEKIAHDVPKSSLSQLHFFNSFSKHAFFDDFWLKNAKEIFLNNFYRIILSDLKEKFRAIKKPYSSNELAWIYCFLNLLLQKRILFE